MIRRAINRMEMLISDLLDAANIRAQAFTLTRTEVASDTLVNESVDDFAALYAEKGVHLVKDVNSSVLLRCDPKRLEQALANLLNNALKFTAPSGRVTVSVTSDQLEATFSVADTGPGISAEDQTKVFERAWQADETAHLGSGMGLYITKGIVEAHAGRIWIESELGRGSKFFFAVPR
jgi:signal transduction histidine kinase